MGYSISREAASKIPQVVPQHQGSLDEQLAILQIAATKLGLYDAADYLKNHAPYPRTVRGDEADCGPRDCGCKRRCGDLNALADHKYAICKGLPE